MGDPDRADKTPYGAVGDVIAVVDAVVADSSVKVLVAYGAAAT